MKKHFALTVLAMMMAFGAFAQLTLPTPSPGASVTQTFGVTEVKIDYSRPGVKGRAIWGGLVPYDKVWRTGANSATAITFDTDVIIDGKDLKAGSYALFTIPGKDKWTIIINSNEGQWGSSSHDEKLDIMRFEAKPLMIGNVQERMLFSIDPVSDEEASITLSWEKLRISFSVKAKTPDLGIVNIDKHLGSVNWYHYARSAEFMLQNGKDLKKAEQYVNISLAIKTDHFFNQYVAAKLMAANGKYDDAVKTAKAAQKQGEENGGGFYSSNKAAMAKDIKV